MKASLISHLLELSTRTKIALCSAFIFTLCFGGWAVLRVPSSGECPENTASGGENQQLKGNWQLHAGLEVEQSPDKKVTVEPPAGEREPVLPAGPSGERSPEEAELPESAAVPPLSRGERVDTVIEGLATWYGGGDGLDGCPTASGEIFDSADFTAAHRELPFGTRLKVTSLDTGKSVVVRVNDRGPFNYGLVLDLSRAAAAEIGLVSYGVGPVKIEIMD